MSEFSQDWRLRDLTLYPAGRGLDDWQAMGRVLAASE